MAETQWNFSSSQWIGLMAAGTTAAIISFISNSCVLILHAFMTWYRPIVVNRLSLRLIAVSVVFNMVYCACQLVTDDISNQSFSCRVIAYVIIASDTMTCMCLAMVGLNLVMIFVLKVSRSIKIEILYYFIVLASGVIVCVVPVYVGTAKGPKNKREEASCWYHYYFNGRINNVFNWMWYYAWLLFSSVFAAFCAAISIRFVVKKQENFNGALDMFTKKNQKDLHTMAIIKKYAADNTDVFQKIARRCICYPLVPLISKSWGVGIEIAATQSAPVPYSVYVLDRIFSCLLGFMISCIYFTDPAIRAVVYESIDKLKQRYVYDYFIINYQPGADPTIHVDAQYPKVLKIVPVTDEMDRTPEYVRQVQDRYFNQDFEIRDENSTARVERPALDPLDHHTIDPTQFHSIPPKRKPEIPTITIETLHHKTDREISHNNRRYSVLNAISVNGNTYMPNEAIVDTPTNTEYSSKSLKPMKFKTIPMHRMDNTFDVGVNMDRKNQYNHQHRYLKHTEKVETLVPYKCPKVARMIHWVLVSIFRVKTIQAHRDSDDDYSDDDIVVNPITRQGGPSGMFRDIADGSDVALSKIPHRNDSISFHPDVELKSIPPLSKMSSLHAQNDIGSISSEDINRSQPGGSTVVRKRSMPEVLRRRNSFQCTKSFKESKLSMVPVRRASSINVATLQRNGLHTNPIDIPSIISSATDKELRRNVLPSKLTSSIGLSKMLNRKRSMSFSWTRLTHTKEKNNVPGSPLNLEPLTAKYADSVSSAGENSNNAALIETNSLGNTRPRTIGELSQADHSSMTEIEVDQSNDTLEPAASFYPQELSPRPRTQYKKATLALNTAQIKKESVIRSIADNHGISKVAKKQNKKQHQRNSIVSDNEQSLYLNELFCGIMPSYQSILDLDNIRKRDSMQSELSQFESDKKSPDTKRISDLSMDQQEGFSQGYTTIDFISNWQESNDEPNRITGFSEPWDLRQQLKQQYELAEDIAHM